MKDQFFLNKVKYYGRKFTFNRNVRRKKLGNHWGEEVLGRVEGIEASKVDDPIKELGVLEEKKLGIRKTWKIKKKSEN